ncbi:highly reducing polyketide synthase 40-like [Alosa sapidissima]|uniref:highly reducing polyketide synthase 40-like n=1 Tax=Alosa sapidissima TaxID=34773 RepID=UPI001C0A376E|nr:highly reducing polyketide synthase 40-like [Alosa sapidissima]XP_041924743.1 highly reducing polyketide synthase 40-like [Alosa sapidissima]
MDDIAVVGIGCNFPGGEGLDNLWKVLVEGRNCAVEIPDERFDCSQWYDPDENKPGKTRTKRAALMNGFNEFDNKFFGITDAEADQMDPQHKLLLQCSYRALEDAGIPMEKASGTRTGVYIGLMNRDYEIRLSSSSNTITHYFSTGTAMSVAANRISYTFNLTGPSFALDSACSSSLVALHSACQGIRQGDCDMALCGGVSCIVEPNIFVALSKAKMISPDGTSKPFSNKADGYGRGEGCGIVLLKPLKRALTDCDHIWGIISKTAVNQDGRTVTPITKPSMAQQEELLSRIYSTESDLTSVQYIEAHGTGTPVGDPIEAGSISKVIAKARPAGSRQIYMGSVKGNIGHTESAAGVAGLIKVLLMMKHETIVPSVFYTEDGSSIDAKALNVIIPTQPQKWIAPSTGRAAGINNFGFGGTNAHVIIKEYNQPINSDREVQKSQNMFVLSAASEKSLTSMIADMAKQLTKETTADIQSLAYTSACKRSHVKHKYRKVFRTSSLTDLGIQLKSCLDKKIIPSKSDPRLVFVFCGNGVTYRGMCRQLLKEEPVFREKIMAIETALRSYKSQSLIEALENDVEELVFSKPDTVQPLLFAVQVAIASLLKHWGVKPDAVLGHSVGEVAAAHCSGLLSLEDAVKVIHYRSVLQNKVTGGKMLVVSNMAVTDVLQYLPSFSGKICLAAHNSPTSCTLSGDAESILALHRMLSKSANSKTLFLHVLDVPAAYHSHMMDPILSEVESSIGSLEKNEMDAELYSTVSGKIASDHDFCTGSYWSMNIREHVEFEKALISAANNKNAVFVEIGPRRALYRNIMETLGNDSTVLSSAQPEKDHETMLATFSKLFELGFSANWDEFYSGMQVVPTSLPRYQFDCVKKHITLSHAPKNTASGHPVLKQTQITHEFVCDLSSQELSYLSEHKNNGVSIIPGALYIEIGLAAYMANAKPKAPLNTLQLSINFLSPFLLTKRQPELKVTLEPAEHETLFKIHSSSTIFASGSIECKREKMVDERNILLDCISNRCTSVIKSDELYRKLDMGGFQYGGVFKNKGNILWGEEFREAYSLVTVPEELLSQVHEFSIHPVILDYLMQMTLITGCQGNVVRPSFPSAVGSFIVLEPLQKEMVIYIKATDLADDHFVVCGCLTDREGIVLAEVRDLVVKYVGSFSHVLEEYFFHNDVSIISEDVQSTKPQGNALVFSDHNAISLAIKPYISNGSKYISLKYANTVLKQGPAALFAKVNISDVRKNFTDILFMWGNQDLSTQPVDDVLTNMANCCEQLRQILLELRKMNYSNSVRVVTYRSSETTVDHISPGFVLSGMTRACAAEISEFTFQLIDIGSVSTEDIKALNRVLTSYPCSEYPELVVKDGQILQPEIVNTTMPVTVNQEKKVCSSQAKAFTLQTADPFRMTSISAVPSDVEVGQIPDKNVEVQLGQICVHSSDYYSVSVSDHNFGQSIYWNKHTNQNHKLLALDFSGIVTAVGKGVRKLKVGDHIAACYPVMASSKIVLPDDVCYRTKKLPFLSDLPCVSYYVVVWRIIHSTLPKLKWYGKLGILSSVPDSGLVKALTLIANKSGWNAFVATELSGPLQDLNKFDALVLLPPFDKSLLVKACTISGVKNIVVVGDSKVSTIGSQNILREDNDVACIQTIEVSSILAKGSIRANQPQIYKWLRALHLDKIFLALPTITFQRSTTGSIDILPFDEPKSYFSVRTMPMVMLHESKGKHAVSDISLLPREHRLFNKNCVYIVTGGLTGLGFETVRFIAERGGGYIVILSRRSPSSEMQLAIDAVKQQCGAVIVSLQCDIAIPEQVKRAILNIEESLTSCPIKGIFHSAVVLHDAVLGNLDKSLFEKVLKPKVNGALNLHHATKHCKLDYFVCFSSIASFLGNASQTNYAAANSFLDTFCHYRRRLGLAAQSINWGALNLGLLLNKDHLQKFLEAQGLMVMHGPEILQSLEQCLMLNKAQQVICKFNLKVMYHHGFSQNPSLSKRLGTLVLGKLTDAEMSDMPADNKESFSSPNEFIRTILSETLGVEYDELNDEIFLSALGVDSMLGMTLQNLIFQERGVNIPLVKLLDPNCNISILAAILMEHSQDDIEERNDDTPL